MRLSSRLLAQLKMASTTSTPVARASAERVAELRENLAEIWESITTLAGENCLLDDRFIDQELPEKYCVACTTRNKSAYNASRLTSWEGLYHYFDLEELFCS